MTLEQINRWIEEIQAQHVLLKEIGFEHSEPEEPKTYEVVWGGRDELLPDRVSVEDNRLKYIPSYDLDEGEAAPRKAKRLYNRTGKHTKSKCIVIQFPIQETK